MHQVEASLGNSGADRPEKLLTGIGITKYIVDAFIGVFVAVVGALIYHYAENLITKPTTMLGIVVVLLVGGLVLHVILLRNAARKIIREREDLFAQTLQKRDEEHLLALQKRDEEHLLALRKREREFAQLRTRHVNGLARRSRVFHQFLDRARDLGIMLLAALPEREVLPSEQLLKHHHQRLSHLLEVVRNLFQQMVPKGTTVFVALRCRKPDGKFHTELRTANYVSDRQTTTVPLSLDDNIVTSLIRSADQEGDKRDCVMLTGSACPNWQKMPNDFYGEDKSALVGAVFVKNWNRTVFDRPYSLNWMLWVCANKEGAFNESHKPFMRCCNDVFSWLLNEFVRHSADTVPRVQPLGTQVGKELAG